MVARPVYTPHPRNFTFYRPAARIGQLIPGQPGQFPAGPTAPGFPAAAAPLAAEEPAAERVRVVWPYLFLASVVGGAAFAIGAGLVNRYVWGK